VSTYFRTGQGEKKSRWFKPAFSIEVIPGFNKIDLVLVFSSKGERPEVLIFKMAALRGRVRGCGETTAGEGRVRS
jgi:hypothetical protein